MTWRHIFFFLIIVLLSLLLLRFSLQKLLAVYYDRSFGTGLILSQSGCPHTRLKPSCTTMVWGSDFLPMAEAVETMHPGQAGSESFGWGIPLPWDVEWMTVFIL